MLRRTTASVLNEPGMDPSAWPATRTSAAFGTDQGVEALVVLSAGRAALQMGTQARKAGVGILPVELQLDVLVEQLEAAFAADLIAGRAEQPLQRLVSLVVTCAHSSSSRSLRRASCNALYRAPRVVSRRSAKTSIGTSFSARATKTCR